MAQRTQRMNAPTTLMGHRHRSRARLLMGVWIVFTLLSIGFCVASLVARYNLLLHPPADLRAELSALGISPGFHASWNIALEALVVLSYFGMAALIAWRKPRDPAALLVALALVGFGAGLPGTIYAILNAEPIWIQPYGFLQTLGWLLLLIFAFIFPNGRFVPRWTVWLLIPWTVWVVGFFRFAGAIVAAHPWAIALTFVIWAAWFVVGAAAQYYRYTWVSTWLERQQTKWVVFGFLGMLLGIFLTVLYHVAALTGIVSGSVTIVLRIAAVILLSATTLLVPLTVGIALLPGMRSMAIDANASATVPAISAAVGHTSPLQSEIPSDPLAPNPGDNPGSGHALSTATESVNMSAARATPAQGRAPIVSTDSLNDAVFVPEVRGPGDSSNASTPIEPVAAGASTTLPHAGVSPASQEQRDDAFVF